MIMFRQKYGPISICVWPTIKDTFDGPVQTVRYIQVSPSFIVNINLKCFTPNNSYNNMIRVKT